MEFQQTIKIPKDRVAVLIGSEGETKKELEQHLGCKIDIDSNEGDVTLKSDDSLAIYTGQEVIKAIARGFNPDIAKLLLKTDYMLELIHITEYVSSKNQMKRLKGRVIGEGGKARQTIEELSETFIVIYGKTIGIVGEAEAVQTAQKAIDMLLTGAPHATVFRILERWKRDKVHRELDPNR